MNRASCIMAAALLAAFSAAWGLDGGAKAIAGQWETEGGRSRVAIAEEDGEFHGAIVWLKEAAYPEGDPEAGKAKRDRNNPETGLQERPLLGLRLIEGFKHDGGNTWSGGTIYDPESGNTYKCKITLDGDTLHVRGYIGISMFGRTTHWTRYEPPEDKKGEEDPEGFQGAKTEEAGE